MMDANTIISVISGVGFPIAACIGLFYLYDKTIKDLTITLSKIDSTLDGVANAIQEMMKDKEE